MSKKLSALALLLAVLLCASACSNTPASTDGSNMLYQQAPTKYEYGVYVNMDITKGDALKDYSVAFNNFADRDAYVIYSALGRPDVEETLTALTIADLDSMVSDNKAMKIQTNDGFHELPAKLLSLEGEAFNKDEKDKFYYIYVVYEGPSGIEIEKAARFITPKDGPDALTQYGASSVGAIVPAGGATSMFKDSNSYSPDYISAMTQGAHDAGVETPRIAVIETTMGSEDAMYADMFLPDGEWASFSDTLRECGMEPVYIPLGTDNFKEVQNTKYFADLVRSCHIVFFTGGDQLNYAMALANADGTPSLVAEAITDVIKGGGTLAGSSAGAAAMSGTVLSDGASGSYQPLYWNGADRVVAAGLTPETASNAVASKDGNNIIYESIGFVEPVLGYDVMIDTHVDARGRIGRLIVGLRDTNPTGFGIGVDETGVLRIDGSTGTATAMGTSGTYIIDASNAVWNDAGTEGDFGVTGLIINYLTVGDTYDFATHTVTPAADKAEITTPDLDAHYTEDLFAVDELGTTLISFAHSGEEAISCDVANAMADPFLTGSLYTFTFEKTADTKCYASDSLYPNPKYFGDFHLTTLAGLQVTVTNGPSKFDPNAGSGNFMPIAATTESNEYAIGIEFSGPISIGFEGNNRYFLDCEEPNNVPEDYVVVYDVDGNVKSQDRTYTFRVDNDNTLRIVLIDDVYFAEGDYVVVSTKVTSLYGETPAAETILRLVDGEWLVEGGAPAAGFTAASVTSESNGYAVGIAFSDPLSIGYEGNNKYFLDCEEPANVPEDYVEVVDADGNVKTQDRTYTFRVDDDKNLRIVLIDDVYFAEGDTITVKTGVTNIDGVNLSGEVVFRLVNDEWVREGGDTGAAAGFAPVSATTEGNEYAVGLKFSAPISVGFEGNNKYFLDCEEAANVPENFVVVYGADGNVKPQDRTYTFRLDEEDLLRIVLIDDVYFAEGDTIVVLAGGVTNVNGEAVGGEYTLTLTGGEWVLGKVGTAAADGFAPVNATTESNEYAVGIEFTAPISVGFEGNNKYFLDCEEAANVPENYVVVKGADGNVKPQDRTYTFRLDEANLLRIVLIDDVYFADGDTITVLAGGVTSADGEAVGSEYTMTLTNGAWVLG